MSYAFPKNTILDENRRLREALEKMLSRPHSTACTCDSCLCARAVLASNAKLGKTTEDTPHNDISDQCPTYYDGCNCTVEVLKHNIARADKAEERLRVVTQILVSEVGADGPCNAEEAAQRAVGVIDKVEKERDIFKAECASISAEFGLPPTIRPAEGEIRRLLDEARAKLAETEADEEAHESVSEIETCDECGHLPAIGNVVYKDSGERPLCSLCNTAVAKKESVQRASLDAVQARLVEVEKERDVFKSECAEISAEFGLPPTIRPSEGEIQRMLAEVRRFGALRAVVEAFITTVDAAIESFARRGKGGQQAPFHGDFCPDSVGPSAISRLKWWVREMKMALGERG